MGDGEIAGLPKTLTFEKGAFTKIVEGLTMSTPGSAMIEFVDTDGHVAARSNPIRTMDNPGMVHSWGDLHGQSEETIGTGSARQYFEFARDRAFVDVIGHQGNDF